MTTLEPPLTLDQPAARSLGLAEQLSLWWNLGISLLLPVTASFLLAPGMSLLAALTAIVVGSVIGNLLLGLSAVPGAETGAPAMVLFRGLFGRAGSVVPTVVNLAQCIGWATFEIVIISETADRVIGGGWRWPLVVVSGVLATLMAIRPLAVVKAMRRYLVWLVIASVVYFFVEVVRAGLPPLVGDEAGWNGFWVAVDIVVALPVSWMPLAADYSRQARSGRDAFVGSAFGYGAASIAFFSLGVLAVRALATDDVIGALIALPAGALALAILAVDELDEAFANVYSTAVSAQNLVPRVDRRVLAVLIGALATALALAFDIVAYENFLFLIGSVFVPLYATLLVDYFLVRRRRWDVSATAPARWSMLLPWVAGFVAYQLINPGTVGWWARWWSARQGDLGFTPPSWLGATLASFVVAAVLTLVVGRLDRDGSVAPG